MSKEEYIKSIIKLLDCDKKEKRRIASDLENDISSALQHGESMSEIMDRMGMKTVTGSRITRRVYFILSVHAVYF